MSEAGGDVDPLLHRKRPRAQGESNFGAHAIDADALESQVIAGYEQRISEAEASKARSRLLKRLQALESELSDLTEAQRKTTERGKRLRTQRDELSAQLASLIPKDETGKSSYEDVVHEDSAGPYFPFLKGEHIVPSSQRYQYGKSASQQATCTDTVSPSSSASSSKASTHLPNDNAPAEFVARLHMWLESTVELEAASDSTLKEVTELVQQKLKNLTNRSDSPMSNNAFMSNNASGDQELLCPPWIAPCLYQHQTEALDFLWRLHSARTGGLLGDEMGLGKTVTVVAFVAALHYMDVVKSGGLAYAGRDCEGDANEHLLLPGGVLVVAPATVIHNWVTHFHHWYPPFRVFVAGAGVHEVPGLIKKAGSRGHCLLTTYEAMRAKVKALVKANFSYVILDEGHRIRNPNAETTLAAKQLPRPHRLLLSGTPIQNNLQELWSLFDFAVPGRLGPMALFNEKFSEVIRRGGTADASRSLQMDAYYAAAALRSILEPHLLRRCKAAVKHLLGLPEKQEQVLLCHLSPAQYQLYVDFLQSQKLARSSSGRARRPGTAQLFFALSVMRKICNHPDLVLLNEPTLPDDFGSVERSGKLKVTLAVLKQWHREGAKVLLFSQTIQVCNIIEAALQSHDYEYRRIDGTVPVDKRHFLISEFQHPESTVFLLLMTTRVGGVGLNLEAANRVLIFDPDWNPMTDAQARERSWRIGQKRDVVIYRLLCGGTVEEKMYHRQIFKHYLSHKVLEDPRQQKFFKWNDLKELFSLPPIPPDVTEDDLKKIPASYRSAFTLAVTALQRMQLSTTAAASSRRAWEEEVIDRDQAAADAASQAANSITLNDPGDDVVIPKKLKLQDTETLSKQPSFQVNHSGNSVTTDNQLKKDTKATSSDEEGRIRAPQIKKLSPPKRRTQLTANYAPLNVVGADERSEVETLAYAAVLAADKSSDEEGETGGENEDAILADLLKAGGIQGTVSHDVMEAGSLEFDMTRQKAIRKAQEARAAVDQAFGSTIVIERPPAAVASTDAQQPEPPPVSLLAAFRAKAAKN